MKKTDYLTYLLLIIAALIFLAVEFSSAMTITSHTSMTGVGVVDRTVEAETAKWYEGSKFHSDLRTPYLGIQGESEVDFTEELWMQKANETEISVDGTYKNEGVFHRVDISSYEVGTRYKFENTGGEYIKSRLFANGNESAMYVEGGVSSKGGWRIIARDPNTKVKEFWEDTDYEGTFNIILDYSIKRVTHSAAVSDWLGCP